MRWSSHPWSDPAEPYGGWWIIRTKEDVEHMSVGTIEHSYAFKAGTRYKVPLGCHDHPCRA